MTCALIRLAVIGHTNAGKTSLLRTLLRDRHFGAVSSRPGTTRQVAAVQVDLGEGCALELVDTPGLEDSMGLLDALHAGDFDPREPGLERLSRWLATPAAEAEFAQEAKALRQLLAADLALFVIDVREPVIGKYEDEFTLLATAGKPCLVVLNFTATPTGQPEVWRAALQRAGLFNVTSFDTVVFDAADEARLLQQVALLTPAAAPHCARLTQLRNAERTQQRAVAARLIAEMLMDCAAWRVPLDATGEGALATKILAREQRLVADLLGLFRFGEADYLDHPLPVVGALWRFDPFDLDTLKELGLGLGLAAAKGAAFGVVVDLATLGHTLGLGALLGGVLGAGVDAVARFNGQWRDTWAGRRYTHLAPAVALFLARRACVLAGDLARRGHAAVSPLAAHTALAQALSGEQEILAALAECARHPHWSTLAGPPKPDDPRRRATLQALETALIIALQDLAPASS